jgi:tetratricopeptide (TPR) repeat protein
MNDDSLRTIDGSHPEKSGETRFSGETQFSDSAPAAASGAYRHIGNYRIRRLIGQGGMGAVYEAEQENPRRVVALKVIRAGVATPELLKRFAQESQALGRLQHIGIAQVYEAGTADSGSGVQPYFAMEFVRGEVLLEYMTRRKLDPRERMEIVAKVCDAVHHAHQRGIIHRDLKPANILVDEAGQPKILDFGVARVTDSDLQATRQTEVGELIGTLPYMSPEQVSADPDDLDTRSDVYALGIILYESLAGKLPYDLNRKRLPEAMRIIQQEDPIPLSSVQRLYRGDVETIAAKALEKDKARRYASAAELAADIRRYLHHEPIVARPASTIYQLQKFAQRNRALVGGVVAVMLVLLAGAAVSTWQAVRAEHARQLAVTRQKEAEVSKALAVQRQAEAEVQRVAAEQARSNEAEQRSLAEQNAADARRQQALAEQNFGMAREAVDKYLTQVSENPQLKAQALEPLRQQLLNTAKQFYEKFVLEKSGDVQLQHELGGALLRLGTIDTAIGQEAQAQQSLLRAIDTLDKVTRANPANRDSARDLFSAYNNLGLAYVNTSDFAKAEAAYHEGAAREESWLAVYKAEPRDLADVTNFYNNLGTLYQLQHKTELSDAAHLKAYAIREQLLKENPGVDEYQVGLLTSSSNLVAEFASSGRFEKAEPYALTAVSLGETLLRNHPNDLDDQYMLSTCYENLAGVYELKGQLDLTEANYRKSLALREKITREHPAVMQYSIVLAGTYINLGELAQRRAKSQDALDSLDKGVETLQGVLANVPREADARHYVSYAQSWRAQSLATLGRKKDALDAWDLAIQFDDHNDPELREDRALELARQGDCSRAEKQADALLEAPQKNAAVIYGLAQVYGMCSASANANSGGQQSSPTGGPAKVVALLKQAEALGYFKDGGNREEIKKDVAFDSLRNREEFAQFLAGLEVAKKEKQ